MTQKTIKSVRRVFEILELFEKERKALSATEISKRLGYPLVSAHALLKSMHELGYADFDAASWTYLPSRNFLAVLGWIPDLLERERNLLDFVEALNKQSMETVNVSRRVNNGVRILHGLESMHSVGVSVRVGTTMPITGSLTGLAALGGMSSGERKDLLKKLTQDDALQAEVFDKALLDSIIAELQLRGSACKADVFISGIGAVCCPVFTRDKREQLIIGVVGPSERVLANEAQHRVTLRQLASEFGIETVHPLE